MFITPTYYKMDFTENKMAFGCSCVKYKIVCLFTNKSTLKSAE